MAVNPYGKTSDTSAASRLTIDDAKKLKKRLKKGAYKGVDDSQLARKLTGKGKKKKKKIGKKAKSLAAARKNYQEPRVEENLKRQEKLERERIKDLSIAVVDVSEVDKTEFMDTLESTSEKFRNFMLKEMAPREIAASMALDVVTQELGILLDGGLSVTMKGQFDRVNQEVSLLAMTKAFCRIHKLDKVTTRQLLEAKIESFYPRESPKLQQQFRDPTPAPGQRAARKGPPTSD